MSKVSNFVKLAWASALFAVVFTLGLGMINVNEAEAGWPFGKTSIKDCNIRLEADSFKWTGNEVRPSVTVTYEGNKLEENKDYELKYDNNVDAGLDTAEVKIKGIGDFKSSITYTFDIIGINIARECRFQYKNNRLTVFYRGEEVSSRNYKTSKGDKERKLVHVTPGNNPEEEWCTYEIYQDIVITGKGQYFGEYVYRIVEVESVLEEREDDKPHGPGPNPGYGGGHNPGPGPNPGHGGGHNPGPGPNPGHGGGHNPGPGPNPGHGPR